LVIDEDPSSIVSLTSILASDPCRVVSVDCSNPILPAIEAASPDLIVISTRPQEPNGFEVCARLKAAQATRGIPVILLLDPNALQDRVRTFQVGASDYLLWPIEPEEGRTRLRTQLELQRLRSPQPTADPTDRADERLREETAGRVRAESALRDIDLRFRVLFDQSPESILVLDPETTRAIEFNEEACVRLGYTREEFSQLKLSDYEAAQAPGQIEATIVSLLGKGSMEFETVHRTKQGRERNVEVRARVVEIAGRPALQTVVHDVTERMRSAAGLKQAEARVRESRDMMRAVLDTTHMMVAFLDRDFNFIWVNRAYADTCRHPIEFFPGRNHFDLYPHAENQAIFQQVVDTGEPFFVAAKPFVFPDQPARGTTYWDWSLVPVKDSENSIIGLAFTLADVTDRIGAENAIIETRQRLELAQESAGAGIWDWEIASGRLQWSQQMFSLFGLNPGVQPEYGDWLRALHPDDLKIAQERMEQALQTREPVENEYRILLPSGEVKWIDSLGRSICDADGKPVRMLGISLDITERKKVEAELNRALEQKEILLKEIHHRVKNNLQVVSGLLQLQADRDPTPELKRVIHESQARIKSIALVHELLYRSRDFIQLDFKSYLEELAASLFRSQVSSRTAVRFRLAMVETQLDLNVAIPCGLIFNELLTNALKHGFPRDRPSTENEIAVFWEDMEDIWQLIVADNGIGIPRGLDWKECPSLGLRLVRMLTQQLRGSIRLDPSAGCRWVIEIPKPEKKAGSTVGPSRDQNGHPGDRGTATS